MKLSASIILLLFSLSLAQSYKILGVFTFCSTSHYNLGARFMKELAHRGHTVTMISCLSEKEPIKNFKQISVESTKESVADYISELVDFGKYYYWGQLAWMRNLSEVYTRSVLQSESVQKLLKSDEEFDVVVMEHFMNDAMAILHHRFNCPLVLLAPGPLTMFNSHIFANPLPPAYTPNLLGNYDSKMNFWERLENTYKYIIGEIFVHSSFIPMQSKLLNDIFPDAPDLSTILYNASILLITSHNSLSGIVPLQQNVKQIGGYHVSPPKPLPDDIKKFLDSSPEGVILFSMGSNLKSSDIDPVQIKYILDTFSKIEQKVIWKFEADLPQKPDNVMISSWLPQGDILAHPNVIGFISHGGLLGTIEAIYHGVPILGLPVFWDQVKNIEEAARKGYGIKINLQDLNEDNFGEGLNELIKNPKYKDNAKRRSKIMLDQPIAQIDEAVFWVEYVVRHDGAPHLRTSAIHLKWYQLYLLDVALFTLLSFVLVLLLIRFIFKQIFTKTKTKTQ